MKTLEIVHLFYFVLYEIKTLVSLNNNLSNIYKSIRFK